MLGFPSEPDAGVEYSADRGFLHGSVYCDSHAADVFELRSFRGDRIANIGARS